VLEAVDAVHPAVLRAAPRDAVIGSNSTTITLENSGFVSDFVSGRDERSAPPGHVLLAFTLAFGAGENSLAPLKTLKVEVSIAGGAARRLALSENTSESGQLFVVALPSTSTPVELEVIDAGFTQGLSLVTGVPDPANISALRSYIQFQLVSGSGAAVAQVHSDGGFTAHLKVQLTSAQLYFFVPGSNAHPRSTRDEFLALGLCYQSADFVDSSTCFSFRATDVFVTPSGGPPISGRSVHIDDSSEVGNITVFEVPAGTTTGTIAIKGSESGDGFSMTITRPLFIPFHLKPQID
jgi:hypothetical protein